MQEKSTRPIRYHDLDARAVEIRAIYVVTGQIRPVHLARIQVERNAAQAGDTEGDQVLDIGAVEIRALDHVGSGVGPVHLVRREIQRDAAWIGPVDRS